MTDIWLPGINHYPITNHGYGPFQKPMLGLVYHVNQSNGRLENFFRNSNDVTPNFQIYKEGPPTQYLPLDWQPWCQTAGNQQYAAAESEGFLTEAWNPNQLYWGAVIAKAYHDYMGMHLQLADAPGQVGLGWHGMGGAAWGNHPGCPGDLRKNQRPIIIQMASGAPAPAPPPPPESKDYNKMRFWRKPTTGLIVWSEGGHVKALIPNEWAAYNNLGYKYSELDDNTFAAVMEVESIADGDFAAVMTELAQAETKWDAVFKNQSPKALTKEPADSK